MADHKTAGRTPWTRSLALAISTALLSQYGLAAQDNVAGQDEERTATAQNPATGEESSGEGSYDAGRIVVYGEKIVRELDETTSSVVVFTDENIRDHGDYSFTDVLLRTPGVYVTAGNESLGIRGVPLQGLGSGSSDAFSIYLDGAITPRRTVLFSPLQLWDVEQIEIFRGAQSTVQGRNSLIGAINLRTRNPTYDPTFSARLNAGTYGEKGGSVAGGGALVDGKVAARIAVDYQESDGYIRNQNLDRDASPTRFFTGRGKLLVEPTDDLDILLTYSHVDSRLGNRAVAQEGADPFDFDLFTNIDARDEVEQNTGIAEMTYDFGEAWTVTSVTSFNDSDSDSRLDFDQTASPREDLIFVDQEDEVFTEELRFSYERGAVRGHISGYYFDSDSDRQSGLRATLADFLDPNILAIYPDGFVFERTADSVTEITNHAVFGEVNWAFAPDWEVVAGLRYDHEENDTVSITGLRNITQFNGLVPEIDGLIQSMVGEAPPLVLDASYDAWLPKFGLNHHLSDDHLVAFTVQRGYRAGGASFNVAEGTTVAFDPEFTINYELAYRGSFLDNRLSLAANLYRIDWNDQQVTVLTDPTNLSSSQVENAGESRLHGVEVSLNYDIDSNWSVYAGGAFNDTEYLDFVTSTQDLSGQNFEGAPKHQYNLGLTYRFSNTFTANINAIYQSERTTIYLTDTDEASPTFGQVVGSRRGDNYVLVNANLQYRFGNFTAAGYVRNLFDEEYITNNQLGAVLDVGAPITAGISLRYDYF